MAQGLKLFMTQGVESFMKQDDEAVSEISYGWAVLIGDCAVFEAKEIAQRLENANIRCRLEILHEDRGFHLYGNSGMGTRMRILVPPSEHERARRMI